MPRTIPPEPIVGEAFFVEHSREVRYSHGAHCPLPVHLLLRIYPPPERPGIIGMLFMAMAKFIRPC